MFEEIVGSSDALRRALSRLERSRAPIRRCCSCGETGTGKGAVRARDSPALGARPRAPSSSVNLRGLPTRAHRLRAVRPREGRVHGSAAARRVGRFELAHGGTLFLDEVGELPLETPGRAPARPAGSESSSASAATRTITRRRARDRGDQSRPRGRGRSGRVPRRTSSYRLERLSDRRSRRCASARDDIPIPGRVLRRSARHARSGKKIRARQRSRRWSSSCAYPWPGNVRSSRT